MPVSSSRRGSAKGALTTGGLLAELARGSIGRVPGTAVYMTRDATWVPRVPAARRIQLDAVAPDVTRRGAASRGGGNAATLRTPPTQVIEVGSQVDL